MYILFKETVTIVRLSIKADRKAPVDYAIEVQRTGRIRGRKIARATDSNNKPASLKIMHYLLIAFLKKQ